MLPRVTECVKYYRIVLDGSGIRIGDLCAFADVYGPHRTPSPLTLNQRVVGSSPTAFTTFSMVYASAWHWLDPTSAI